MKNGVSRKFPTPSEEIVNLIMNLGNLSVVLTATNHFAKFIDCDAAPSGQLTYDNKQQLDSILIFHQILTVFQ